MQDPIFQNMGYPALVSGATVLGLLNSFSGAGGATGWIIDEYDALAPHGPEIYLHTRSNFGTEAYFSMKMFIGAFGTPHLLQVWANTGYDSDKRVDNQPGMFAKTSRGPTNACDPLEVFSGDWDDGGVNASVSDPGIYKTDDGTPTTDGSAATFDTSKPGLWFFNSGGMDTTDLWFVYDANQGADPATGGSRSITMVWYTGNSIHTVSLGKVIYDDESPGAPAVDKTDGNILSSHAAVFDDRALTNALPINNSLGGEVTGSGADRAPIQVIRNYTDGSTTYPAGTPDGSALAQCGTLVLNEGHLEFGDHEPSGEKSSHHRPDQGFDDSHNSKQPDFLPNPKTTIHYDHVNQRRAFCRHRNIARINGGRIDPNNPPKDWKDSEFHFPWYFAPTRNLSPGDKVNNGTREYLVFPGNRGGDANADSFRYAGLAFRLADLP